MQGRMGAGRSLLGCSVACAKCNGRTAQVWRKTFTNGGQGEWAGLSFPAIKQNDKGSGLLLSAVGVTANWTSNRNEQEKKDGCDE